jgi:large subunit ribosomal protein L16
MRQPKRSKFTKIHRSRARRIVPRYDPCQVGEFGLKALEGGEVSAKQVEATRRVISRRFKRQARIDVRVFTNLPRTAKALGVRMGKGRGAVDRWVVAIRPGQILFEIKGTQGLRLVKERLKAATHKLPVRCTVIERDFRPRLGSATVLPFAVLICLVNIITGVVMFLGTAIILGGLVAAYQYSHSPIRVVPLPLYRWYVGW